jgi:predicted acylesterase/phospholipase RssA
MTKIHSSVLLALLLPAALIQTASANTCYAIAFSAGDERAAYQAGVFTGLVNNLPADQVAYSAVSGVEGGAINAAILSQFNVG